MLSLSTTMFIHAVRSVRTSSRPTRAAVGQGLQGSLDGAFPLRRDSCDQAGELTFVDMDTFLQTYAGFVAAHDDPAL